MEDSLSINNPSMIQSMYTMFCDSNPLKKDAGSFINFILNEHFELLNIIADLNSVSTDKLIDMIETTYNI